MNQKSKNLSDMLEELLDMYPEDGGFIRRAIWEARRLEGELADAKDEISQLWVELADNQVSKEDRKTPIYPTKWIDCKFCTESSLHTINDDGKWVCPCGEVNNP